MVERMSDRPTHTRRLPRFWPSRAYYGWAIVFTSFFISVAQVPMYGPVFSIFLKPIEESLGWSRSTITIGFTIGSLGGALLAAAVGPIVDRYGARIVVAVTGLIVTAGLLGVAAISEPWHLWLAYGAARTASVAGVGLGTTVAIANWFIRMRGRAIAIRAAGQRAGQSVVPLLILPVLLLIGWRESFVVLAVVALLFVTAPALLLIRRRPEDYGLLPDGDTAPENTPGVAERSTEHSWLLREVRATRTLWMIALGMSAGLSAQIAINVHAVANFQDEGISEGLAITIASIFTGVAAVSMAGWGMLLERVHVRYVSIAAMGLFIVSMVVLIVADTYPMAVLFAVLFGLGTGGWTVSQMIMIPNYFGRLHAGSIKGFISPVEGVIGISGPLIAAMIFDATQSYRIAFIGAAAAFAVSMAAFYLAKPLRRPTAVGVSA